MLTKKEQRKEKTREAIKQAALSIAENEGWGGVTIRKIADEVLYTPPIVYEFFKNKEDLYQQLVKDGFSKLTELTTSAINPSDSPEQQLLQTISIRYDFAVGNKTLHQLMFDADNSSWHEEMIIESMRTIKEHTFRLLATISGHEDYVHEYFLNLVCLVKGYTFFEKHLCNNKFAQLEFMTKGHTMKAMFLAAIQRFIESIKS